MAENTSSTPSEDPSQVQSASSQNQNPRRRNDIAWNHCSVTTSTSGKTIALTCTYCHLTIRGGGINRMKQHLAGIKGNVKPCSCPAPGVRNEMLRSLESEKANKRNASSLSITEESEIEEIEEIDREGSSKRNKTQIESYMKGKAGIDYSQPSIKAKMQSKEIWHATDMAFAMWMYDACIPFNAVNSPYFQAAIDRIATMGHGYTGPSYHQLKVPLLKEAKTQLDLTIANMRSKWVETGCTIMADGWSDRSHRALINFLVYSPAGISFIKSVDASSFEATAENLCAIFSEVVEIVGVNNVVHMVTDNAANYKKAGSLLNEKYPSLFWSPCSAHCINLILKDVAALPRVDTLSILASKVTSFVYNRKWAHSWLRQRQGWTEIIVPGATRFGTTFIALHSLWQKKTHLQTMVLDPGFKKFLREKKGRDVKKIVLDDDFWNNCLVHVKVMSPIMKFLRICDSDEKPSLGYVFEGMSRAINGIKETFQNKEQYYHPFVAIIEDRWDRMLRKSLHAAAYWLNPAFQFDPNCPTNAPEVMGGVIDVVEKWYAGCLEVMSEINMFREQQGTFGRQLAVKSVKTSRPDHWWITFGGDTPYLQKMAIKILSQTSSSSGCERNWSVFERIHTKKRNRLEHQRLNDLVFVHYNARLQQRASKIKHSSPVDCECIDKVDYWIVDENDTSQELDSDELEEMVEEEPTNDANLLPLLGDDLEVTNEPIDLRSYDKGLQSFEDMVVGVQNNATNDST